MSPTVSITGLVVQWGRLEPLAGLLASWDTAVRAAADADVQLGFELLVVDNGPKPYRASLERLVSRYEATPGGIRLLGDGTNLGFAGAVNLAARASHAEALLILNPDAHPRPDALHQLGLALVHETVQDKQAGGLVPALIHPDGSSQAPWQLRPLPSAAALIAQGLFLDLTHGPQTPPVAGTAIEQPAAAALLLRRQAFDWAGGMDEQFFPAWFEDVDLARRIARDRRIGALTYCPQAIFEHALGSSVPGLGYGPFLWAYYRNLTRYLAKHHGSAAALLVRGLLPVTALLRGLLVPLRKPSRAETRRAAARGLVQLALGAVSNWRSPKTIASSFERAAPHRPSRSK